MQNTFRGYVRTYNVPYNILQSVPEARRGRRCLRPSLRAPHQVGNPSYVRDAVPRESPWDARETVKARLAFVIENHRKS